MSKGAAQAGGETTPDDEPQLPSDGRSERRGRPRRHVLWRGVLQTVDGPFPCLVLNVSLGGAKLAVRTEIEPDRDVTLMLGALGVFPAIVVWTEGGAVGIRFVDDQPELARRLSGLLPR
jgi:hypothetical protein